MKLSIMPGSRAAAATGEGLKMGALALLAQPQGIAFIFSNTGTERSVLALGREQDSGDTNAGGAVRDTLVLPAGCVRMCCIFTLAHCASGFTLLKALQAWARCKCEQAAADASCSC